MYRVSMFSYLSMPKVLFSFFVFQVYQEAEIFWIRSSQLLPGVFCLELSRLQNRLIDPRQIWNREF